MKNISFCFSCSANCCKEHKLIKCNRTETIENNEREEMEFLTEDTIPGEKLQLLDKSDDMKKLLSNHHLRIFLKDLDNAKDPEMAIRNAMLEPLFVEFADECLKIIEPPDVETKIYNKVERNLII